MIKNNKTFKNIFGLLLTSVLLMVGCGSSSNNPVSSGNVSNGLVNVSGTVNNLSGNGRVSFYTPTAVARNGMNSTSPFRASISNEGVYTFTTDENNSYSGQIPEGNYYIIAENSDGTMRAVSELQNLSNSRAVTRNFELSKIVNISGKFVSTDDGEDNAGYNLPVYIKGLPFITVTDSTGAFTFTSVPCIKATDSETKYTITSTMNYRGNVFTASTELTSSHFSTGSDINNLKLTFELGEDNVNYIQGYVYNNESEKTPVGNHIVVAALSSSGEIISTVTDSEGLFIFAVGKNENYARISADLVNYTLADDFSKTYELTYSGGSTETDNNLTVLITASTTTNTGFSPNGNSSLTIYKKNDSKYELYRTETVYLPLNKYAISNLGAGNYSYMIENYVYQSEVYYGFYLGNFDIEQNAVPKEVSDTKKIYSNIPVIKISNDGVYSTYIDFKTIVGEESSTIPPDEITVFSIIENEDGKQNYSVLPTGQNDYGRTIATITFDASMASGTYNVYGGYSVSYNGMVATVTSDPFTYVKH